MMERFSFNRKQILHGFEYLLFGIYFGIVLTKSEVVSWYRIQKMFRFEEAHMYLVIASAIVVGIISMQIIKRFHLNTVEHQPIKIKQRPFQWGIVYGGAAFGMGWAITGACPGPIYAQIGSGEGMALITFAGAILGMFVYAWLQPKLPH